jgi:hypothetical protein
MFGRLVFFVFIPLLAFSLTCHFSWSEVKCTETHTVVHVLYASCK